MTRHSTRLRRPADFGLAVKQSRLALGLTRHEPAERTGLRPSAMSETESGTAIIHIRRLLELARETGLEFSASWGEPDDDRSRG